jgi:glycosyltransferase involved in cell wall biosynthesis
VIAEDLNRSSCLILCSKNEPFGVPVLEALFCGCPVISTKCGGPEEISRNVGGGIILVDHDDVIAMKNEILRVLNTHKNDARREAISKRAMEIYGNGALTNMWFNICKNVEIKEI